jgi:hypothetical protein
MLVVWQQYETTWYHSASRPGRQHCSHCEADCQGPKHCCYHAGERREGLHGPAGLMMSVGELFLVCSKDAAIHRVRHFLCKDRFVHHRAATKCSRSLADDTQAGKHTQLSLVMCKYQRFFGGGLIHHVSSQVRKV